jgi:hypothetical protein
MPNFFGYLKILQARNDHADAVSGSRVLRGDLHACRVLAISTDALGKCDCSGLFVDHDGEGIAQSLKLGDEAVAEDDIWVGDGFSLVVFGALGLGDIEDGGHAEVIPDRVLAGQA